MGSFHRRRRSMSPRWSASSSPGASEASRRGRPISVSPMTKIALVLFNLGGPDVPTAIEPFLFNLFNDPAIISLPGILRYPLAKLIARRRAPIARDIYARLGGGSPLLANTEAQARALEASLRNIGELRCFVAMRYWRPFIEDAGAAAGGLASADDPRLLLSARAWLHHCYRRPFARRVRPASRDCIAPGVILGPWTAKAHRRARRSLSLASRAKLCRCGRDSRPPGSRLADLLSEPRRPPRMDRSRDGCGDRASRP